LLVYTPIWYQKKVSRVNNKETTYFLYYLLYTDPRQKFGNTFFKSI